MKQEFTRGEAALVLLIVFAIIYLIISCLTRN